ncbi:MAG: hypothetical protein JWM77_2489 [Rhodospirillales bacterium]|nr:hypothetical protein [Rhodospirillales bacterium]
MRYGLALTLALSLIAGSALADPPSRGSDRGNDNRGNETRGNENGNGNGSSDERGRPDGGDRRGGQGEVNGSKRFSAAHKTEMNHWFASHRGEVEREDLPPGIAKKLARGRRLPPGIAGRELPPELHDRIVVGRYQPVLVGRDVVLLDPATSLVVDILRNALR